MITAHPAEAQQLQGGGISRVRCSGVCPLFVPLVVSLDGPIMAETGEAPMM